MRACVRRRAACVCDLRKAFTILRSTTSCACRLPARRQFSIPQRKGGGHWDDFEVVRQELQPFLHTVQPGPASYRQCSETDRLALTDRSLIKDTASAFSCSSSSQNAGDNGSASQGSGSGSAVTVSCSDSRPTGNNGTESGKVQEQPRSSGGICSENGVQLQHRMPTQQELIAAGRMDLLNAMRVWGGFTAVADLMGVHPNTRYFPPDAPTVPLKFTSHLRHSANVVLLGTIQLHVQPSKHQAVDYW